MSSRRDPSEMNALRAPPLSSPQDATTSASVRTTSIAPTTDEIDSDWSLSDDGDAPAGHISPDIPAPPRLPAEAKPVDPPSSLVPVEAQGPADVSEPPARSTESAHPAEGTEQHDTAASPRSPRRSRVATYVIGPAMLTVLGAWFALRSTRPEPSITAPATQGPEPSITLPATQGPAEEAPSASSSSANPASPATPESPEPAAAASPAAASADPAPTASGIEAEAADMITVQINIQPEGSRITLKGREIGRTPFTLELPRGERRVFEVVHKGYVPRRLVIDGSRSEISYGLKPEEE